MKYATPREAAKLLGIAAQRIRRNAQSGIYPFMMIGSHMVVDVDAIREILEREDPLIERMLGIVDLSKKYGLTDSAIRRGTQEGWLPYMRRGRKLLFDTQIPERHPMIPIGHFENPSRPCYYYASEARLQERRASKTARVTGGFHYWV